MNDKEKLTILYYGESDIGLIRTENQDSIGKFPSDDLNLYSEKGQLFIVADGMGGHAGGKEASSIAVNTIREVYFSASSDLMPSLKRAVEKANNKIYSKSENSKEFRGMGTTCTVLVLKGNNGTIAHVGDSRIYLADISSHKIEQLTEDHTKVNEMLKEGLLTKEEADAYPSKNVLARALGVDPSVKADFKNITIKKGQIYILCSDGLAKVTKDEILQIVTINSTESSCKKLIALANDRGGKDNVTVMVIKIGTEEPAYAYEAKPVSLEKKKKKYWYAVFIIIFLLLAAAVGFQYRSYFTGLLKHDEITDSTGKKSDAHFKNDNVTRQKKDSFDKLQARADELYKKGRVENALIIYKKILSKNPMHLGALQGMNNIASVYIDKAERYKNDNNYQNAIIYFKKALQIQPSNKRLQKLITECEMKSNNKSQ